MDQSKNRAALGVGITVLVLVGLAVGTATVQKLIADEPQLPDIRIEAERGGAKYCADFFANDEASDQVEVKITNCGNTVFTVKHGRTKTEVAVNEDYMISIPQGVDDFRVKIQSLEGEPLGTFIY